MADFYYLYDPSDNLALGQAIHLANTDGGMSYIVPFVNKNGTVNAADAASVALQAINTAIAAGPLNNGGTSDPVSNRISAAAAQGLVGAAGWSAIKAMVKASINQAPPAGWSEASLEDAATTYSVISSKGYSKLQQDVFTAGKWKDADTSLANYRGNPYIAFGGQVLDAAFIDYSGHHVPTPGFIGQETASSIGINRGVMYAQGDSVVNTDIGDPVYGLAINAPGKDVTLVNFSATSTGFGRGGSDHAADALGFTRGDGSDGRKAIGTALGIYQGNVILSGDLVVDQLCQVVEGTQMRGAAITISGKGADVTIDKARVFLGAVRGWESMINVSSSATLVVNDSTIYGFSSSNSNSPLLPRVGLDWKGFNSADTSNTKHSNGLSHLLDVYGDGVVRFVNSSLLREDAWVPTGEFSLITDNLGGSSQFWLNNDYKSLANGDLYVGQKGTLEIDNSKILGTILTDRASDNLTIIDSVVAGSSLGILSQVDGVLLEGDNVTLRNSLFDNLDVAVIGQVRLKQETDAHILDTNTPELVSVTTDSAYTALPTFAGPSSLQRLEGWADLDNAATGNKAVFQFQGPQTVQATPSNKTREIPVLLSQAALPRVGPNGAVTYSLTATFDEAVDGFDSSDLQKALGTSAVAAGWQVAVAPFTRDAGRSWNFQLQSPVSFSAPVSLQLATGAAQSTLVTFPSSLESSASNSISLVPVAGVGSGASLRLSSDGLGLVVDGVAGSGLWLKLDALAANASWQNSLELTTRDGVQLGAVGATPNSSSLGTKELFLAAGQELRFSQSSRNDPSNPTPAIQLSADAVGFRLRLDDGGGNLDRDYNDLDVRISSSPSASDLNTIVIARLQTNSMAALLDLTSIASGGARFNVLITTDCADINRLGFVRLASDPLIAGGYTVAGVAASNTEAFRNAVRDNIINPGATPLHVSGQATRTVTWDLTAPDAGIYAPVLINQSGQVLTFGATAADGQTHCKVLGDNNFGFEDVLASKGTDWDYNDVKIKILPV